MNAHSYCLGIRRRKKGEGRKTLAVANSSAINTVPSPQNLRSRGKMNQRDEDSILERREGGQRGHPKYSYKFWFSS